MISLKTSVLSARARGRNTIVPRQRERRNRKGRRNITLGFCSGDGWVRGFAAGWLRLFWGLVRASGHSETGILKKHIHDPMLPPPAPRLTLRPLNHSTCPSSKRKLPPDGAPRSMRWTAVATFLPL